MRDNAAITHLIWVWTPSRSDFSSERKRFSFCPAEPSSGCFDDDPGEFVADAPCLTVIPSAVVCQRCALFDRNSFTRRRHVCRFSSSDMAAKFLLFPSTLR